MKASDLNWSEIRHFALYEFPGNSLGYMSADYIRRLDAFRHALGSRVYPSGRIDAWYRLGGSTDSRHYAVGRLSDAGDVFPDCDIRYARDVAIACGFGGVGVYIDTDFDGKPWPMLHLDTRPLPASGGPMIWIRDEGKYIYPHRSRAMRDHYYALLARA